ncbi:MAG TPA: hypothetical protein ACHBX0_12935 [Arsenophonus sp.]
MPKKRRVINKNVEESVYLDSPDGLLVAASKNKHFACRLVSEFKKLKGIIYEYDTNGTSHENEVVPTKS